MKTQRVRIHLSVAIMMLLISFFLSGCEDLILAIWHEPDKAPPPLTDKEIATIINILDRNIPVKKGDIRFNIPANKSCSRNVLNETFEYRDNRIILRSGTDTRYYARVDTDEYCSEGGEYMECITHLRDDSYVLTKYNRVFSGFNGRPDKWTVCYSSYYIFNEINELIGEEKPFDVPNQDEEKTAGDPDEPQPESQPVVNPESQEQVPDAEPQTSEEGEETTSSHQFYSWYGSACDEMEGTFPYTWEVHLMLDSQTGATSGTVKFHNCPGGGRVLYTVTGTKTNESLLVLQATKQNGGGTLYKDSPDSRTFNFDWTSGRIVD